MGMELVNKCKNYCTKLESHVGMAEKNLYKIKEIQSLQKQLEDIYHTNFMLLGGTNALEHVEARTQYYDDLLSNHQKMKDLISTIRKTFPDSKGNAVANMNGAIAMT